MLQNKTNNYTFMNAVNNTDVCYYYTLLCL